MVAHHPEGYANTGDCLKNGSLTLKSVGPIGTGCFAAEPILGAAVNVCAVRRNSLRGMRGGNMSAKTKETSGVSQDGLNLDAVLRRKTDPAVLRRGVLALDPGSQRTGWAWWRTSQEITPAQAGVLQGGKGSLGERMVSIRSQLQEIYDSIHQHGAACHPDECEHTPRTCWGYQLGSVACEKPIPHHKFKSTELEAVYAEIRNWAKGLSKKRGPSPDLFLKTYANSQVKAVVNPRLGDWKVDGSAKEKLMAGVVSQFGLEWRAYEEDAIDAIAVGIAHLQVIRGELLMEELIHDIQV